MNNMIKLDDNYFLVPDSNNWTLKYEEETDRVNKKTGKVEVSKDEWYYPTLSGALNKYLNQVTKTSKTTEELIEAVKEVESKIDKI